MQFLNVEERDYGVFAKYTRFEATKLYALNGLAYQCINVISNTM
jgi:hypothetical protein